MREGELLKPTAIALAVDAGVVRREVGAPVVWRVVIVVTELEWLLEPDFELGLTGPGSPVVVVADCSGFALPTDLLDSALESRLSTLVALLASNVLLSSKLDLLNVFQSHSPPCELSHLALQPTPTPSIAARGSSCSLKSNQFA